MCTVPEAATDASESGHARATGARSEQVSEHVIQTCRSPASSAQHLEGATPAVFNLPNAATLNTTLHAVVTPGHKIIFIANS